jgi:hypothetical protein
MLQRGLGLGLGLGQPWGLVTNVGGGGGATHNVTECTV